MFCFPIPFWYQEFVEASFTIKVSKNCGVGRLGRNGEGYSLSLFWEYRISLGDSCNSYERASRIEKKETAARVSTNHWIEGHLRAWILWGSRRAMYLKGDRAMYSRESSVKKRLEVKPFDMMNLDHMLSSHNHIPETSIRNDTRILERVTKEMWEYCQITRETTQNSDITP